MAFVVMFLLLTLATEFASSVFEPSDFQKFKPPPFSQSSGFSGNSPPAGAVAMPGFNTGDASNPVAEPPKNINIKEYLQKKPKPPKKEIKFPSLEDLTLEQIEEKLGSPQSSASAAQTGGSTHTFTAPGKIELPPHLPAPQLPGKIPVK